MLVRFKFLYVIAKERCKLCCFLKRNCGWVGEIENQGKGRELGAGSQKCEHTGSGNREQCRV